MSIEQAFIHGCALVFIDGIGFTCSSNEKVREIKKDFTQFVIKLLGIKYTEQVQDAFYKFANVQNQHGE